MNTRQQTLLNLLKQKKTISLDDLCILLSYSASTVRRDIALLESIGLAKLEKGIVKLIITNSKEKHFTLRNLENIPQKDQIAKLCEDFFRDGMSIFLDSSSTTLRICPLLANYKNVTVITNGIETAHLLMQMPDIEIFVVGGYTRIGTSSLVGESAIDFINQFNVDLAIISCYGIDIRGVYDVSMQQAYVKRAMMDNADLSLLLCDSSKFNHVYKFTICNFKDVDYILSEVALPPVLEDQLTASNCENLFPE